MTGRYAQLAFTEMVQRHQQRHGSDRAYQRRGNLDHNHRVSLFLMDYAQQPYRTGSTHSSRLRFDPPREPRQRR